MMKKSQSKNYSKSSEQVKEGYKKIDDALKIADIYDYKDFCDLLSNMNLDEYKGKSKHRTLIKKDIRLYKSIIHYTDELISKTFGDNIKKYWVERLIICQNGMVILPI